MSFFGTLFGPSTCTLDAHCKLHAWLHTLPELWAERETHAKKGNCSWGPPSGDRDPNQVISLLMTWWLGPALLTAVHPFVWYQCSLTFDLWPPKCTQFILDRKWTFVPSLKKWILTLKALVRYYILHSQERDEHTDNVITKWLQLELLLVWQHNCQPDLSAVWSCWHFLWKT